MQLHERGDKLRESLQDVSSGTLMKVTGYGSILCFHFTATDVDKIKSPNDIADDNKTLGAMFHLYLLEKEYYAARRGFVALSLAIDERDLSGFVEAVEGFLASHQQLLALDSARSKL